jgi:hypothetical protein
MTFRKLTLVTTALCVALATWGAAAPASAQQKSKKSGDAGGTKPAAPEKTGIAVGETSPQIKLKDQAGKERSLEEWLHDGTVAVVFYRSASW